MSNLPSVEPLQCDGDPMSLGHRWEKWKRALEIFLLASNIEKPVVKRATLLHMGGTALQEIYYNIPGAHVNDNDITEATDVYEVALEKLNEYFLPKQSKVYERHIFRLLKQEPDERFEKFLVRLRQQSKKCKFASAEDDNIIDQVVEKCYSMELKKRILTLGDDVTLDKVIYEANAIESVQRQLSDYGSNNSRPTNVINKIETKRENTNNKCCSRCGNEKHNSDSRLCPARDRKCSKCGYIGHYMAQCRTRQGKRKFTHAEGSKMPNKKFKYNNETTNSTESKEDSKKANSMSNINYIFYFDADGKIKCDIGGVNGIELLIDSGSKHNILTDKTWNKLKSYNIQVTNQKANPDKIFMAYGSSTPLKVLGSFEAVTKIGTEERLSTFYVIEDGTRDLLGKETAVDLKVLKLGLEINMVSEPKVVIPFPKFKGIKLDIAIDNTVTPVSQPCRRIPVPLEERVNKKIDELIKLDIIEPVNEPSKWVNPIVPVLKGADEVRLCVDMRIANKAILREHYPLPTMDQILPKFNKARFFSKLDIKDAFHQIEISEGSRHITTFITNRGLFRYKRLMFGISCAPELFQKTLEKILLPCEGTLNFIDDIIVYGKDEREHEARLNNVLEVLKNYNVVLNREKCIFNARVVQFLGHQLSAEGVKPLDSYIKSVETFREPKTIEEVQSFLGLLNYVNKWIPNFSTLTEPIRKLLTLKIGQRADVTGYWKHEQKTAFVQLKDRLQNIPTLGYYDPKDKTQVLADASPVGLGAVLVQIDNRGPRIIAFGNRSLSEVEKRYCQTEREALALVWAVEHFHVYLYGRETFDLVTDHKPLEVIFGSRSKPCARIERWVLRMQSYNYKVIYRPGKNNIADPFSRLCYRTVASLSSDEDQCHINQLVQYARPNAIPMQVLIEASEQDEEIQLIKEALNSNAWDSRIVQYRVFQPELWFHDGILLRGDKIVIPSALRKQVLEAAHEGHPGIVAMKARLRTKVWWPKVDKDAEAKVKSCRGCTLASAGNPPFPLKRRNLPDQAWQDIAIDYLGPLPSGHYLLVVVDYYSRYKEIKSTKSITTTDTTKILKDIFSRLGIPLTITADNGRQFISQEFKDFCQEMGIKLISTTPYSPQENGEVERQNRDILKRLQISQSLKTDWQSDLLDYLMMYNSTPHNTTGKTPGELFFCRKFRDKLPSIVGERSGYDSEVRDKDIIMKDKGKEYADRKRRAIDCEIDVGEKVYVKNMTKENKLTAAFNSTPHTVLGSKGNDYTIRNDDTGHEYRRNVMHLKKVEGEWKICEPETETIDTADKKHREE